MSLSLYDEALISKFKYWTENTNVKIYGPNDFKSLIESNAFEKEDSPIKLPIIALTRAHGYAIQNTNKRPLTYNGKVVNQEELKATMLDAVPIDITYTIDVYTRFLKEADMYMRNLVFNIINYPTLQVTIPYHDLNFEHNANIRIVSGVEDTSDGSFRMFNGQFTRLSMSIDIDDAYLWDVRIVNNLSIDDNNFIYAQNPDKTTFSKEVLDLNLD